VSVRTATDENFPDDRRVGLPVRADAFHGVLNPHDLSEGAIQRANARAAGQDQGTVYVEKKQPHAAILREDELFLRLQVEKHCQILPFHLDLESALGFLAHKPV
jgi:hypothetical protein